MNRGTLNWMVGGAGFLLAAALFSLLALSEAGKPAAPQPGLAEEGSTLRALPRPEEIGIVLPPEPEHGRTPPARQPQSAERELPPDRLEFEDEVRELERQGILTY